MLIYIIYIQYIPEHGFHEGTLKKNATALCCGYFQWMLSDFSPKTTPVDFLEQNTNTTTFSSVDPQSQGSRTAEDTSQGLANS